MDKDNEMELTQYQLYDLMNRPGPLWLAKIDLSEANLEFANLKGANLYNANLRNADLRGANLEEANLCCADLSGANLSGANLKNANMTNVNLSNTVFGAFGSSEVLHFDKSKQNDLKNRFTETDGENRFDPQQQLREEKIVRLDTHRKLKAL